MYMRILGLLLGLGLAWAQATHTVERGDTLFSLAKRYNTSVEVLMQLNGLASSALQVGRVLRLPQSTASTTPAAPQVVAAAALPTPQAPQKYTVQRGDTLFSLARRFSLSVQALMQANRLSSENLSVGQILTIPVSASVARPNPLQGSAAVIKPLEPLPSNAYEYDPKHPLVQSAMRFLGTPYLFGGSSNVAIDCSAFVQRVFADVGVALPRTSREQWAALPPTQGELRLGDLVFFSFGGKQIDHVGIYMGRNVFAHASSYGSRVVFESLDSPHYQRVYRGARRPPAMQAQR